MRTNYQIATQAHLKYKHIMNNRLFFSLNIAQRKVFNFAERTCEEQLDVSIGQIAALLFITKHPNCLQKDVAQELRLNKSAITGLLGRMEKNKLIERTPCSTDARATLLQATSLGKHKAQAVIPFIQEFNRQLTEGFSDAELQIIQRFLAQLMEKEFVVPESLSAESS